MTVTGDTDLEALARRVDDAVTALADLDPAARAAAEELRAALEDIHRVGLTTIVRRMRADDGARPLLFELVDDPVVRMLLTLHGVIRRDPPARAGAPDGVRPLSHGHGGEVPLIPVEALLRGRRGDTDGWVSVARAEAVPAGEFAVHAGVLLVNLDHRLSAYRNECAHEALPLDGAVLDASSGTLTCPWHGFCYDATSGECLSAPGAQLEPLPLRVDDGDIWVRFGG